LSAATHEGCRNIRNIALLPAAKLSRAKPFSMLLSDESDAVYALTLITTRSRYETTSPLVTLPRLT
jgi:hypothetical protein